MPDLSEPRPLPECLTRFLAEPAARRVAAPEADAVNRAPVPPSSKAAMRLMIGWAVLFNVAGAAILCWLYASMGAP